MLSRDEEIARLQLLLQGSLDRVANGPDAGPVLEFGVGRAAARLADLLAPDNDPDDLHSRWLLGWVFWHRYRSRPEGGDRTDFGAAIAMHAYCLAAGHGPLPGELLAFLADELVPEAQHHLAEAVRTRDDYAVGLAAVLWERILEATPREDPRWASRVIDLGTAHFIRFESFGDREDLDRAETSLRAAVLDTENVRYVMALLNLGNVLVARCQLGEADGASIDETVDTLRRAERAAAQDDELRAACAAAIVTALRLRFKRTGDRTDLAEAIHAGRFALEAIQSDHPCRPEYMSNLGTALLDRFGAYGDPADLDHAIDSFRQAVEEIAAESPRRVPSLSNLGVALRSRYIATGSSADLDEAIEVGWTAVNYLDSDPYSTRFLEALAESLHLRYESTRSATDLDQLLTVGSAVVASLPAGHLDRPRTMVQLAYTHQIRFGRDRALIDLDTAIRYYRQADGELPLDHPHHWVGAGLLGQALLERFSSVGESSDLQDAIVILRTAVESDSPESTYRALHMGYLARALLMRFELTRDSDELDQSIRLTRVALSASSTSDDDTRVPLLSCLVAALGRRFEHSGDLTDLNEVIDVGQRALHVTADRPHPDDLLYNLGVALARRHHHTGTPQDRDRALAALELVARTDGYGVRMRIRAAQTGGFLLADTDPTYAAQLLAHAVDLLDNLVPRYLEYDDQQRELHDIDGVAADAAALALQDPSRPPEQRARRALELLEKGRAIMLGQGIEFRSDTSELAARHPDLAERLESLRHTLSLMRNQIAFGIYAGGDIADSTLRAFPDPVRERRTLSEHYTALLGEIRSRTEFSSFTNASEIDMLGVNWPGAIVVFNISRHRSDALLVTNGIVSSVSLPTLSTDAVTEQVAAFRRALRDAADPAVGPTQRAAAQRSLSRVLQWLWDNATGPILETLGHHTSPDPGQAWPRVWWAPGGLLGNLPIHAAGYHNSDPDARSVLDRVVSSYTVTLRALAYAGRRTRVPANDSRALIVSMPTTPGVPGRLHFVDEEVRTIRRHLHNPCIVTEPEPGSTGAGRGAFFRTDELVAMANSGIELPPDVLPSRNNVLKLLSTCTMVHFACHAHNHPTDPSLSALQLHDGPLTVGMLATAHPRHADLAYLSACETAQLADDHLADEGINLVSAFQLAGYAHVIGTLWEVNDDVAATIAAGVYQSIAEPDGTLDTTSTAEVLHHVVRNIRDNMATTPSLWAAHIHAGT